MQALLAANTIGLSRRRTKVFRKIRTSRVKTLRDHGEEPHDACTRRSTTDELGCRAFYLSYWHALWVPTGTPKEIVAKLNASVIAALAEPAVRQRLDDLGQEVFPSAQQTPETLAPAASRIDRWWPIIKAAKSRRSDFSIAAVRDGLSRHVAARHYRQFQYRLGLV